MRIKNGFELMEISGQWVIFPIGSNMNKLNGVLSINETGRFLFRELNKDVSKEVLVNRLSEVYNIHKEMAQKDVDSFIELLESFQIVDN